MSYNGSLIARIDAEIERRSLLKHPFYQMWSQGDLTVDNLRGYAKEYFQLVKAVPEMVGSIATHSHVDKLESAIQGNAAEERAHVLPWVQFANSLGVSSEELSNYSGAAKTLKAVSELKSLCKGSFEESVAAMYSYEAELPKISRSKIDGLEKFYNMHSKDSLNYFEIHEEADVRHAQVWREVLQSIPADKQDAAFDSAVRSLDAQNMLLDSVLENHVGMNMRC